MKKRLVALLCLLAIVVSVFAVGITAQGATEYYQVGYSKMDINPWLDPKDHSKGIILAGDNSLGIPLSGYGGNAEDRIATSMIDDNGDGYLGSTYIGEGTDPGNMVDVDGDGLSDDGLFTTCTIVADPDGKLLIFFTLDCISPYGALVTKIRSDVVSALTAKGANISADRIMITGSHSHTSVRFDAIKDSSDAYRSTYYEYIISQMNQAAVNAYADMADATMSKRELDVSEDYGYQMNWVRHVNVPYTVQQVTDYKSWSSGVDSTKELGNGILVAGSNFGFFSGTKQLGDTENLKNSWGMINGTRITQLVVDTANRTHVAEADDTLQMLTFEFSEESGKDTVVMIDWRAHPDNIGNTPNISSDYVGALRYRLEQNKTKFGGDENYRVGFWQGTAGNINAFSAVESEPYFNATVSGLVNDGASVSKYSVPFNKYGYLLAEAALLNLEGSMGTKTECSVGSIRNLQIGKYTVDKQVYTDAEEAAAAAIGTTYAQAEAASYPFADSASGGVINSKYHWSKVNTQITQKAAGKFKATTTIEINALMIGDNMAFVVSPNELFDRYDADMSINDVDNDWNELISDTYGMPFVLAYTNGHDGYMPNVMAYHYNEGKEYKSYDLAGQGSYEVNNSDYAERTGEELIDQYASMLQLLSEGTLEKVCPQCGGDPVVWQPVTKDTYKDVWEPGGHYYLTEDVGTDYSGSKVCGTAGTTVYTEDGTFCLDLHGCNVDTVGRAFNVQKGNTLNLMDSVGTSVVTVHGGTNNPGGGVLSVSSGGYLNVYGGTYKLDQTESGYTGHGGIAMVSGTMTMHGGTLVGGELKTGYYDTLYGAAVVVNGKLEVYGGAITAAEVNESVTGNCVYVASNDTNSVTLSGDAYVDEIYFVKVNGTNLIVDGSFTGYAKLHYNSTNVTLTDGLDIGNSTNASFHQSAFTVWTSATNGYASAQQAADSYVDVDGTDIKYFLKPVAQIISGTNVKNYSELDAALSAYTAGATFKLMESVDTLTVGQNMILDLNGCTVQTLATQGYTASCMDSQTADSDISDGVYGKVVSYTGTGTVEAVELSIDRDTYLMVETDDGMTFHAVDLRLTTASLRPYYYANGVKTDTVGLYYKGAFAGDTVVADKVEKYGVALSTVEIPTEDNLDTACARSYFEDFVSGAAGNSSASTVLYDIMKLANTPVSNRVNAEMKVYARAYVETADGILFGEPVAYSLKDIMALYDAQLKAKLAAVEEPIQGWYNDYTNVMKSWSIPYIKNFFASEAANSGEIKILGIGNSFTIDCMKPLLEIYKAHSPNKKVTLGILYHSGCVLAQHVQFLNNGEAGTDYDYYEISYDPAQPNAATEWEVTSAVSMYYGIHAHDWDIVTMQQGVKAAARVDTYNDDIGTIRGYVIEQLGYEPKFVWNMTWALPEDANEPDGVLKDHPSIDDYYDTFLTEFGGNKNMYAIVASAVQNKIVMGEYDWEYVIPVGTAIQNAKWNYGLDYVDLYADYCHLRSLGSIIASYTWYCELNGLTEIYEIGVTELKAALIRDTVKTGENTYDPVGDVSFSDEQLQIIKESVNGALKNNFAVTAP